MNRDQEAEILRRMRARRDRLKAEADAKPEDEGKTYPTADKPKFSPFEKDAAAGIEELRKTMRVTLGNVIKADDRSRADKTPHEIIKAAEEAARLEPPKPEPANENYKTLVPYQPVEKLVNGYLDGQRWKRVKRGIQGGQVNEWLGEEHYHDEVLGRSRKERELNEARREEPLRPWADLVKDFEERYEKRRDEKIEQGIKEGFLKRDEEGRVTAVIKEKDRPGEKLAARRIRRSIGRQDDGGRDGAGV